MTEELQEGLQRLESLASVSKVAATLVSIMSALTTLGIIAFINNWWPEALVSVGEFHGLDLLVISNSALLLLSMILVGMWIYRAHANVKLADSVIKEFSPGWAIGWFCVPIMNLVMPFRAMKELWQSSTQGFLDNDQSSPGLLWVWWISWILSGVSSFGLEFNLLDAFGYGATAFSAICLARIIATITEAQPRMSITSAFE